MQMNPDQQNGIVNHCRILQLLTKGCEQLHRIFRGRWSTYHKLNNEITEWNDDEASGKELVNICSSVVPNMKAVLQKGKLDLWDITLTNLAIQAVTKEIEKLGSKTDKDENKTINALRELRNDIMHGKSELSNDRFQKFWNQLVTVLSKFGIEASEFEDIKNMKIGQAEMPVNSSNVEFKKLKDKAAVFFKSQKYKEAIEIYNQILEIPGLLPENQALIFSNRSGSYLLLKEYNMAERDAKFAIDLWPCWWRGYYRLGRVEAAREKWSDAEKTLNKAYALNSNKEVFHELSIVRTKIGIQSRYEHLNPAQQTKSHDENLEELCIRAGISKAQAKLLQKQALNMPEFGDIIRGHYYRDGHGGVEQDYSKAASYYGKAAAAGQAEAMYNLGRLYHHGYGVPVDYEQSMYWLEKAANANPFGGPRVGSGVPEAQHMLGLKYSEGLGVKKDFKIAAEWYEKAVKNGFAGSANNLALQYKNGQGVERSAEKAFEYHKIAAKWGDTAAMQNLAGCYFTANGSGSVIPNEEDIAEGMKWLRIAAEKGDLLAAQELERRKKLKPIDRAYESFFASLIFPGMQDTADPLDREQYGKVVQEAAKKGSAIAQRHLDIWKNLNIAMDAFKKNNPEGLVAALAKAVRLDFQVVKIPEMFGPVISGRIKTHSKDLDTIVCNVHLNSKNMMLPKMIVEYLNIFPNDEYLLESLITSLIAIGRVDEALVSVNKVLQMFPQSSRLLYCRAIALCLLDEKTPQSVKALDDFLKIAPPDHDKVPACYYRKAFYYLSKDKNKFTEAYEAGLAAEKKQLPCFLPYFFPNKNLLERTYLVEKKRYGGAKKCEDPIKTVENLCTQNLEQILVNEHRKVLVEKHRTFFTGLLERDTYSSPNRLFTTVANLPNTPKPPRLVSLKEITLKEMDPTNDKVYDGYVLEARILEWSYLMTSIATVIEDKNGDVERLAVYNWPLKGNLKARFIESLKTFRPNSMVSIINPYMRMAKDMQSIIRVESPEFIRIDSTSADKRCYCCGKEEAKILSCSKCLMARYCSKECQKADWIDFKHKDICKHLKPLSTLL